VGERQSTEAPRQSAEPAATALRPATEPEAPRTARQSAPEISVRLPESDGNPVSIRLRAAGDGVRVAVRTPDTNLASRLREQVGDLLGRLEESGWAGRIDPVGVEETSRVRPEPGLTHSERPASRTAGLADVPGQPNSEAGGRSRDGRNAWRWLDQIEDYLEDGAARPAARRSKQQ
jgi:hypothetical protein